MVGNGGSVISSSDDGETFSVFNRPDRISLSSVTAAGDGNLILTGRAACTPRSPTAPKSIIRRRGYDFLEHSSSGQGDVLERLIFNNRPAVILICLLVSIFLFWQAR
jgi:hypothetical protein